MGLLTTSNYDIANAQMQKEPIVIFEIEGLTFKFSSNVVYTQIRYDDPGVLYNGVYQYDGLRPVDPDSMLRLIDRKGSFSTISQKLEQWDGKASVETFNIKIIDYQQIMTKICTPGYYLDDILNKKCRIFFGYSTISYPEDYLLLFKGYINSYKLSQGAAFFTLTDPSSKRKEVVFNGSTSTLTAPVLDTDTTINVTSTANFYQTITNPKGITDSTVTIGLVIDGKEIVTYTNADILSGTQVQVVRGAYGTTPLAYTGTETIEMFIFFSDNPINISLKTQLSGWNGPWISNINLRGIINTDNGSVVMDSITFAQGVDVVRDYGLTIGDFITLSGSSNGANNATFTINDIINNGRTVVVSETGILIQENPGAGYLTTIAAFRSKYDVYPITAGLQLTTDDVFVSQHEFIRDTFIQSTMNMPVKADEKSGKEWIEKHLYKPVGAYSLTQGARISLGISHPPLSSDLTKIISPSNIVDAKSIEVDRGVDTRFFYNEVVFLYNYDPLNNKFNSTLFVEDADSQNLLGKTSTLEIEARGYDNTDPSRAIMIARANRILQRYRVGAETISLRVFFGTGHTIDGGDTVVLTDTATPTVQISNTETGTRGIYNRVMEVQERTIDISNGVTSLKLLSNNGFSFTDRYGVVSCASLMDSSFTHTTTLIRVKDSFYTTFPEWKKWEPFVGSKIKIHNANFTNSNETYFTQDPLDKYKMILSPALSFVPTSDCIVEFANYDETSALINAAAKAQFCAFDSSSYVLSGSSSTVFVLQTGYASRYTNGMIVYIQSIDCTRFSPDVKIVNIVGDTITIGPVVTGGSNPNLGFTPQNGDIMQFGGFKDGGQGYRLL